MKVRFFSIFKPSFDYFCARGCLIYLTVLLGGEIFLHSVCFYTFIHENLYIRHCMNSLTNCCSQSICIFNLEMKALRQILQLFIRWNKYRTARSTVRFLLFTARCLNFHDKKRMKSALVEL